MVSLTFIETQKMIHEEIVTFEVAKLAKEKGFPQKASRWRKSTSPCRNYYNHKGELNGDCLEIIKCICRKEEVPIELQTIVAPTQSLLQRWLREEKGLILIIRFDPSEQMYDWGVFLETQPIEFTSSEEYFEKYELALEDAIKFALENLV